MIEAYLFDGAQQSDEECEPFSLLIESTNVLEAFTELMQYLEVRKRRDTKLQSLISNATKNLARQLNEAILLDANYLKNEDEKLLRGCMQLIMPELPAEGTRSHSQMLAEVAEIQRKNLQRDQVLAECLGIDISDVPRWEIEEEARNQDVEVLLLKYMLIRIASCRKEELYRDMLKLNNLHESSRYGLKRTVREALLCRVFGFDQAAASLCGAAIEHELFRKLISMNLVEKSGRFYYDKSKTQIDFGDMIQIAFENHAFSDDGDANLDLFRKAQSVVALRNNAMHHPDEFNRSLKASPSAQDFVLNTRQILEAVQVSAE